MTKRICTVLICSLFSVAAGDAAAQSPPANASIIVSGALKLAGVSTLSFGKVQGLPGRTGTVTITLSPSLAAVRRGKDVVLAGGAAPTALVRTIMDQPGRLYRVQLPTSVRATPGGYTVSNFRVWSDLRGDITATKLGQLGVTGEDTLRIGATLSVPAGAPAAVYDADIPVTVLYE
jgi:hypothetical protein